MADLYVKTPDGRVVVIDSADAQRAADSGYTPVDDATIRRAQAVQAPTDEAAAAQGLLQPEAYNPAQAFAEKTLSAATFGLAPGLDSPESIASGRRFQEEQPYAAFGAELLGQLPLAMATAGAGAALTGAAKGAGLVARGAAAVGDVGLGAAVGGAQTEAEQARLAAEEFSFTDAAVAGVAGEVLGRGAAWGVARGVGAARNLMTRAERDIVATDAAASLAKGGWLNDYRVAQHADEYQTQLAELASKDLDTLEESFQEVSRQDRKRARITRVVADQPELQAPVRMTAVEDLRALREALSGELGEAPSGPAKRLVAQLDDRIAKLEDGAPSGKKLWRTLDENRQALQEYRQDLHQAYETNPGAAWLSREGLAAIDAAEKATREALLREDVWGEAAAKMQREYNVPFHEKYFPTAKTVRGDLMFSPHENAEGFRVYRGDPAKVRRFLSRDLGAPDGHRLSEQFRDYLDGVEAIARAGESDTPQAAHRVLESVRRLRKAQANAAHISAASTRAAERGAKAAVAVDVAAGAAGAATFGVPGAVGFAGASRGLRVGHWLAEAAERLGLGRGRQLDMAKLLGEDALPAPAGRDAPFVDDVLDSAPPPRSGPPSGAPPAGPGGGLSPSIMADATRGSWAPSGGPAATVTAADEAITPSMQADATRGSWAPSEAPRAPSARPGRESRAASPTRRLEDRQVGAGQEEALYYEDIREVRPAQAREAGRLAALAEGEFRDVVQRLKATGDAEAGALARELESRQPELAEAGLVESGSGVRATAAPAADAGEELSAAGQELFEKLQKPPYSFSEEQARNHVLYSDNPSAILHQWGGKAPSAVGELAQAAAFYEQRAARQSPDLARFLEKAKDSVRVNQEKAGNWWDAMLGDSAPQPAAAPPAVAGTPDVLGGRLAERVGNQGGVTTGGFFRGTDGVTRYVKFSHAEHQLTEAANTAAYRDFGVDAIEQTIERAPVDAELARASGLSEEELHRMVDEDGQFLVLSSEKARESWSPVVRLDARKVQPEAIQDYVRGWPADVVLGNWDIAGNGGNILTNGRRVLRLDAGEAGANSVFQPLARDDWEDFVGALGGVKKLPPLVETPHTLLRTSTLSSAKEPLLEGIAGIRRAVDAHGGFPEYVAHRFPHLPPAKQKQLAEGMSRRLFFLQENVDAIAGLALVVGTAALTPPAKPGEAPAAGAAAMAPLALFGRRAGLFRSARAKVVADVAKRLFSATAQPAARVAGRLVYSRTELAARQKEFQSWSENPQELVDRVAEGFRDVPPEHSGSVAGGVFRTATFLKSRLPTVTKLNAVSLRQIPVSTDAMAKYARYEQAALQPREALQDAAAGGHLSAELMETLGELYPDLLAELRVGAIQTVQENGPPTSVQSKLSYARLFDGRGELADPAFSKTVATMTAMAYEQAPPPQPGAPSSARVSQLAQAVAAPTGLPRLA